MLLEKIVISLKKIIKPAILILNGAGVTILALMMLLTASDVLLRYIFNRPIIGSLEITEYMMAIVVAFGLAYCASQDGHVRVEIIVDRLPHSVQTIVNGTTSLLGIFLFTLITWQCFVYTRMLFHSGLVSTVVHISRFPFACLVGIGSLFLTLILLVDLLEILTRMVRK